MAACPFHCGLAVNVQRNNHTVALVVIATCRVAKTNTSSKQSHDYSQKAREIFFYDNFLKIICFQYLAFF